MYVVVEDGWDYNIILMGGVGRIRYTVLLWVCAGGFHPLEHPIGRPVRADESSIMCGIVGGGFPIRQGGWRYFEMMNCFYP